jgi:cytoskeletal protein RodZ
MPLDTGDMAVEVGTQTRAGGFVTLRPGRVILADSGSLGAALAAARLSLGLEVEDIASATRLKASYIRAMEAFDFSALPSRPFVIGFFRAYARALGLETEAVVARFRAEAPPIDDDLQAPVRIDPHTSWAPRIVALAAGLIVLAVVGWNLWRHAEAHAPLPAAASSGASTSAGHMQAVILGAPLPMPPEASAPPTYQTPGLSPEAALSPTATPDAASGGSSFPPQGAPFHPQGAVYGAPAPGGSVILQAHASTAVVVRGSDGGVVFARELAKGEAWRAPGLTGLTVEADSPAAVEVYVNGAAQGVLPGTRTPLAHLTE